MATGTYTLSDLSTDTPFRTWVSAVSTFLTNAGFALVADSGDLDTGTVTAASGGYQIWRFADSLHATAPIYFKITFTQTGGDPRFSLQVGDGSDGAGTLTNPCTAISNIEGNNHTNVVYMTGDGDGDDAFVAILYPRSTTEGGLLLVERSRDADGTPNGDGAYYYLASPGYAGGVQGFYPTDGTAINNFRSGTSYRITTPAVAGSVTWVRGSDEGHALAFPSAWVKTGQPLLSILFSSQIDKSALEDFTITRYGRTRTYRFMGNGTNGSAAPDFTAHSSAAQPCLLWE